MRGKGLPYYEGSSRGDLKLRMQIKIPEHISAEQRQLYEQLRELNKKQNQKKHWWEKNTDNNR
jgi:molecular chaperone DnaJ